MAQDTILQQTIIEELGLQDLPQEKKDELLIQMAEVVLKRIYSDTIERLEENDRNELGKMLDEEAEPEKVESFLRAKMPDYEDFLKKIISNFKEEMKETMLKLENSIKNPASE